MRLINNEKESVLNQQHSIVYDALVITQRKMLGTHVIQTTLIRTNQNCREFQSFETRNEINPLIMFLSDKNNATVNATVKLSDTEKGIYDSMLKNGTANTRELHKIKSIRVE